MEKQSNAIIDKLSNTSFNVDVNVKLQFNPEEFKNLIMQQATSIVQKGMNNRN
jgi:hypothetical protein